MSRNSGAGKTDTDLQDPSLGRSEKKKGKRMENQSRFILLTLILGKEWITHVE